MPDSNPLDGIQPNPLQSPAPPTIAETPPSIPTPATPHSVGPDPITPAAAGAPTLAPVTHLDPTGQPKPGGPSPAGLSHSPTTPGFGAPPSFNPDSGPSPLTSALTDPTPSDVYGSLDRPSVPTVQTHEGPAPLPGTPVGPMPSEPPREDHRTYLLFLIGLGVIFFIVLAIAYLTRPH